MANKEALKVPISRDRLMEALRYRKSSITKLGKIQDIDRTEKSIRRCLKQGAIPPIILDRIGKHLDVHPDYLSGKYDKTINYMKENNIKSQLIIENFPYFVKEYESLDYKEYFRNILLMHCISMKQFMKLTTEQRFQLQLDIERAITKVIPRYFTHDAKGRPGIPELQYLEMEIQCAEEDIFEIPDN